jgi:hypothetical protein
MLYHSMHSVMSADHTTNSLSIRNIPALRFKRHKRKTLATGACIPSQFAPNPWPNASVRL